MDKDPSKDALTDMLSDALVAFTDLVLLLFREVNEHAIHHAAELPDDYQDRMFAEQARFVGDYQSSGLAPTKVVKALAQWLGHKVFSESASTVTTETSSVLVPADKTLEQVLKEKLGSNELSEDMASAFSTLLNTGTVDQIDAQIRDDRAKFNPDQN